MGAGRWMQSVPPAHPPTPKSVPSTCSRDQAYNSTHAPAAGAQWRPARALGAAAAAAPPPGSWPGRRRRRVRLQASARGWGSGGPRLPLAPARCLRTDPPPALAPLARPLQPMAAPWARAAPRPRRLRRLRRLGQRARAAAPPQPRMRPPRRRWRCRQPQPRSETPAAQSEMQNGRQLKSRAALTERALVERRSRPPPAAASLPGARRAPPGRPWRRLPRCWAGPQRPAPCWGCRPGTGWARPARWGAWRLPLSTLVLCEAPE